MMMMTAIGENISGHVGGLFCDMRAKAIKLADATLSEATQQDLAQQLPADCLTLSQNAQKIVAKRKEALSTAWENILTQYGLPIEAPKLSQEAQAIQGKFNHVLKIVSLTTKANAETIKANAHTPPSLLEMKEMLTFLENPANKEKMFNLAKLTDQQGLELVTALKRSALKEEFNSPAFRAQLEAAQLEAGLQDTVTHGKDFEFAQFKPTEHGHTPLFPLADLNLAEANMKHTDVSGLDLTGKALQGTDFSHSNLAEANLQNTNLQSTNFEAADLTGADFSLTEADPQNYINNLNLTGANLQNSSWRNRRFASSDFNGLSLPNVDLSGTEFSSSAGGLYGADLTTTDLSGAKIHNWDISKSRTGAGTNLTKADLTGLQGENANLINHQLAGANLTNANLKSAILPHANLTGANLTGADLRYSHMQGANLNSATLTPTTQTYDMRLAPLATAPIPVRFQDKVELLEPTKTASLNGTIFTTGSVLDHVDFRGANLNPNLTEGEAPLLKSSTFYDADLPISYPLEKIDDSPEGFKWNARRAFHNPPTPPPPTPVDVEPAPKKQGFLGGLFGKKN